MENKNMDVYYTVVCPEDVDADNLVQLLYCEDYDEYYPHIDPQVAVKFDIAEVGYIGNDIVEVRVFNKTAFFPESWHMDEQGLLGFLEDFHATVFNDIFSKDKDYVAFCMRRWIDNTFRAKVEEKKAEEGVKED